MAEIEEPVIENEEPPKRGRGRPKGSLNKKTLAKREAEAEMRASIGAPPQKFALDVSFEETPEEEVEPEPEPEPERPEPEPEPPKRTRKKKPTEITPEESAETEEEPEEPEPPPPSPKKRAKRQPKHKAQKPVRMTSPEPPSYLEIVKRGLELARHKQKAEKVAKYDSFFRY